MSFLGSSPGTATATLINYGSNRYCNRNPSQDNLCTVTMLLPMVNRKDLIGCWQLINHSDMIFEGEECFNYGTHQGGHATARLLEGFLESPLEEVPLRRVLRSL